MIRLAFGAKWGALAATESAAACAKRSCFSSEQSATEPMLKPLC